MLHTEEAAWEVCIPDLSGIFALIIAVLPGIFGEWFYRMMVGVKWGSSQLEILLRLVGFSVLGFALYCLVLPLGAPEPTYAFPKLALSITPATLPVVAIAYIGHCAGSIIAGIVVSILVRKVPRWSGHSPYPCAWDEFARHCAEERWITVGLRTGEAYMGMLKAADYSVPQSERDIILTEPALYNEERGDYVATADQFLFLPADIVQSVAAVSNTETDQRITQIGEGIFKTQGDTHEPGSTPKRDAT